MKLTSFLILVTCLHVSANGIGQHVTLSVKDASLKKIFTEIIRQSGVTIVYTPNSLKNARPVTLDVQNASVEQVLDLSLKNQPFQYVVENGLIIVKPKTPGLNEEEFSRHSFSPPPITIKGKVLNEKGEPVVVSIIVKGTKNGTTTDNYGNFVINSVDGDATLIISGINVETQEIKIDGRDNILIKAATKINAEEEVIINKGYYSEKKRLSTGNVSKVTSKEIGNQPVVSPLLALQGRVPGLEITMPANATPGVAPTIRIRGNNSLRIFGKNNNGVRSREDDGNYPLYVIDGVPVISSPLLSQVAGLTKGGYDPISTINPTNIESIEILKDADATSIYGARGGNGVILITTKQNRGGERTNFDVSAYRGAGMVSNKLELLNTEQYLAMRREALLNEGLTASVSDADLKYWDQTRYTDWQKVLLGGTANITDIQGNIAGGGKNTSFRIGGGLHKETLIFSSDFVYQRVSGNASFNHSSTNQRFKMVANLNYGTDNNNLFADDQGNIATIALTLPPNAPKLFNDDGSLNWEIHTIQGTAQNTWTNPLAALQKKQRVTSRNLITNVNISYRIAPSLSLSVSAGYTDLSNKEKIILPLAAFSPTEKNLTGTANFNDIHRNSWIIEPKISYSQKIKKHTLDFLLGTTWQETSSSTLTIGGDQYTSDALLGSLVGAGRITIYRDDYAEYKYNSIYGRIGYNWEQKYLLNLTGRRDASSRFSPNKRSGNFGSIGLGWIFSEEGFIQKTIPFLSFGKIRGSYGVNGSDAVSDYQFYDLYEVLDERYNGIRGLIPSALYNPDFVWEATKKLELGLEIAFLDNRLGMEMSWYLNRSSNQLINYTMPYITGFPSVISNFNATVQNTGLEAVFRAEPIVAKNWRWNISLNFSIPHNKLLKFDGIENSSYVNEYKVGAPLSIQWLYSWTGVDPQTGLFTFVDENKDGVISDLDRRLMNSMDNKYYGGISNSLQYKGIELSVQAQYSNKQGFRYMPDMPGRRTNQPTEVLNRWFAPGDQTDIQRFATPAPVPGYVGKALDYYFKARLSNYNIQESSFIRIKSLSLGYSLNSNLIQKAKLHQVKIFIQGQNLLTITSYKGLDPETGSGLPPLRMITGGIQIRW